MKKLALLVALAASLASPALAQNKMTYEQSVAELNKLQDATCSSLQLFAAQQEGSSMLWVGSVDDKTCKAKLEGKLPDSAKAYVDGFLSHPNIQADMKALCAENKDYTSVDKCLEDLKSDKLTKANAQLRLYHTGYGIIQHICSSAIKEATNSQYHPVAGICTATPLPKGNVEAWKTILPAFFAEMNQMIMAPVTHRCASFAGATERFPILKRLSDAYPVGSAFKTAQGDLSETGFACVKDDKDPAVQRCTKTYSTYRFLSDPEFPGGLQTISTADTFEITLKQDGDKIADICANTVNVGL
ncbi:MAG: hypothetical protein FJX23_06900 [Alphaproteobacteria bacterium]|nr:hypothetical protein [Alphaproteobacteria bacterium]